MRLRVTFNFFIQDDTFPVSYFEIIVNMFQTVHKGKESSWTEKLTVSLSLKTTGVYLSLFKMKSGNMGFWQTPGVHLDITL